MFVFVCVCLCVLCVFMSLCVVFLCVFVCATLLSPESSFEVTAKDPTFVSTKHVSACQSWKLPNVVLWVRIVFEGYVCKNFCKHLELSSASLASCVCHFQNWKACSLSPLSCPNKHRSESWTAAAEEPSGLSVFSWGALLSLLLPFSPACHRGFKSFASGMRPIDGNWKCEYSNIDLF